MRTNNRTININQDISTKAKQRLAHSSLPKLHTPMNELIKGEVLKGEVINLLGTDIQILLSDGQVLKASLETSLPLFIGDSASFLVEQSTTDSLILKLLPNESISTTDATVNKALDEAQLPKSEKNITVVQELLKNGMSIDKNSIINLLRQSATFRSASIETLVIMNKYHIPITQENTTQLEAYRNYEFRLLEQSKQLTKTIINTINNLPESSSLAEKLYSLLTQPNLTATDQPFDVLSNPNRQLHNTPDLSNYTFDDLPSDTQTLDYLPSDTRNLDYLPDKQLNSNDSYAKNLEASNLNIANTEINPNTIKDLGISDSTVTQIKGDITDIKGEDLPDTLGRTKHDITNSESILETLIKREFTLPYHKLTEPESISKFYEKLERNLEIISDFFKEKVEQLTREHKDLILTQINNVKENIDFMKTLNQLFGYLQLPMKLPNQEVHSELFVYTNKKSLQEGNQQVSVLLHLDMAHLGPIDFHLTLKNQHVTAKISIKSPESMTLIEQHLPELSDALEARGYSMTYELEKLDKETKVIREALETNSSGDLLMRRYSFDIRA